MIICIDLIRAFIVYVFIGAVWVLYGTFGIPIDQGGRKIRYNNKRGLKGLMYNIMQWPLTLRMIIRTILRNYDHLEED